jgi:hypothetical protein
LDISQVLTDVAFIISNVYRDPAGAVKNWTDISCDNYQIPLGLIEGLLLSFCAPGQSHELQIRQVAEHDAVVAIVQNSHLNLVLQYDVARRVVRYRDEIPISIKEEIAQFIARNTTTIEKTEVRPGSARE